MKIVVLRNQKDDGIVDLLLVMNYDEKFDAIAEQVVTKYHTPDPICDRMGIDYTDYADD